MEMQPFEEVLMGHTFSHKWVICSLYSLCALLATGQINSYTDLHLRPTEVALTAQYNAEHLHVHTSATAD